MSHLYLWKRKKGVQSEKMGNPKIDKHSKKLEISENVDSNILRESKGECIMSNPLMKLTETELRDLCRHHIDTFENWSRRIIDENLLWPRLFQLHGFGRSATY